ncbi:MAG: UDP-2,3-diacylglucosamine diphosphatase LpxI [Mucispirillum sp.]|uniref:UDP-2,3-diacylglucosamine diphosphatase LpxI n=1 Tax=Candidatus Mucispirillum faecigallinarum TaxID=2838699 RepID=A0A9D2GQS3_9BACT|nr:UDP-2,3-diacylglucosamine diphosphatase LpxI [Mucispirillum sp.]HIZ88338.1 UDP-2,3-diacylglucosamine diphosphatase LpxI [Candidatus Mucispirillum faecigallinarum]
MEKRKVAIIAGYGSLPLIGAKYIKEKGDELLIIALKESCTLNEELKELADYYYEYSVGLAGKMLKTLKKHKITHALLSGKVEIKLLHSTRFDLKALLILAKISLKSTDSINLAIINEMKKINIEMLSQKEVYSSIIPKSRQFSKRSYIDEGLQDIVKEGFLFAKHIGYLDLGQSIVISREGIMAVESAEGTDITFARGSKLGKGKSICIKTGKAYQDERFDLPTVGLDTLRNIAENGGLGLVMESGETIVVDMEKCIEYADEHNLIFTAVSKDEI